MTANVMVVVERQFDVPRDRVFRAWLYEAYLVGLVPEPPDRLAGWPHQWFWDGREHVDPQKEATAQATRLASHTTTLADEYARKGQDWEAQLRQRAKELALMTELGLAPAAAPISPLSEDSDADTEEVSVSDE